jgi:cell division septation protein DedD
MATHAGPAKASVKPKPIKLAQAAVAAKPATAPAADAAPAVAGGVVAQIGAFSSEALAQKGWSDVAALVPGQMSGKTRKVEEASRDGKTFYRAFVGGFASKAAAQSFCASLAARGHGCMVK